MNQSGGNTEELQQSVLGREKASEPSFWLGYAYPRMNLLTKGDVAYICYFPIYDHPGYISQSDKNLEC